MWNAELESRRWLEQAKRDVGAGWALVDAEYFEQACFMSQQAAEKAVKSIAYGLGERTVLGHSVVELIRRYSDRVPALRSLLQGARVLDLFYIPTRYPNGLPGGLASEAFSKEQAKQGLDLSERFLMVADQFQASGSAESC